MLLVDVRAAFVAHGVRKLSHPLQHVSLKAMRRGSYLRIVMSTKYSLGTVEIDEKLNGKFDYY